MKLDKDIKEAKERGNKALKKHLKRKYEKLGMPETRLLTFSQATIASYQRSQYAR